MRLISNCWHFALSHTRRSNQWVPARLLIWIVHFVRIMPSNTVLNVFVGVMVAHMQIGKRFGDGHLFDSHQASILQEELHARKAHSPQHFSTIHTFTFLVKCMHSLSCSSTNFHEIPAWIFMKIVSTYHIHTQTVISKLQPILNSTISVRPIAANLFRPFWLRLQYKVCRDERCEKFEPRRWGGTGEGW